jgi:hypothetical protein
VGKEPGLEVGRGVTLPSPEGRVLKNNAGENVCDIRYSETSKRTVHIVTCPFKEGAKGYETYPISDLLARDADHSVRRNEAAGTFFDCRLFHHYSAVEANSLPMCRRR